MWIFSGFMEVLGEWFGEFLWVLVEVGYDVEWFCIIVVSIGVLYE